MGISAVIETMESKGFEVQISETGRLDVDQWACYVYRANCGKGFFGMTEAAALKKAVEAVEAGEVGYCQKGFAIPATSVKQQTELDPPRLLE